MGGQGFFEPCEACGQFLKETRAARSREIPMSPVAIYLKERQMRAFCKDAVNRPVEEICKSTGVEPARIASDLSVRKPLA